METGALGENAQPVVITQNEYMRRMKDISKFQSGMNFYAQMPDAYSIVLNTDHRLVKAVLEKSEKECEEELKPVVAEIKGLQARFAALGEARKAKKPEEVTQEEKDDMTATEKKLSDERAKKEQIVAAHAKDNKVVHQLIDLALLQNGMLKGEALDSFIKRSVEII